MTNHVKNIKGKRFTRLVVKDFSEAKGGHAYWLCKCDCGKELVVRGSHLKDGGTKSCGCYQKEMSGSPQKRELLRKAQTGEGNSNYKHGESNLPLFKIYQGIVTRCNVKSAGNYKNYGGRGIKINWESYLDFKKDMNKSYLLHVKKYGRKQTTIDRIDSNGNYCKSNCKWSTYIEQETNRRDNRFITHKGKTMCLSDWDRFLKFPKATIGKRLSLGWTEKESIETPVRKFLNRR